MPAIVVLVVLLTGFLFTSRYPLARFKQIRSSGWAFYLHAFAWGSLFSSIAVVATLLIDYANPTGYFFSYPIVPLLERLETQVGYNLWLGVKFWTWGLISTTLAWVCGFCTSKITYFRQQAGLRVAKENEFEMFLYWAATHSQIVQVTLLSRKVYIGFVFKTASVDGLGKTEYLSIVPIFSGYRKEETLKLTIDNNYFKFYWASGLLKIQDDQTAKVVTRDVERFKVVIPAREVAGISFFDVAAHEGVVKASTLDRVVITEP